MPDNIDRYVPEFDEEGTREKLAAFEKDDLVDMLIRSYKMTRLASKMADESDRKLSQISALIEAPSELLAMLGVPAPEDLKKMLGDNEPE